MELSTRLKVATPEQPKIIQLLMEGGLAAIFLKMIDLIRASVLSRRRDDATVEVAKIKSREERIAALETRMDRRDIEHAKEIATIRAEAEVDRRTAQTEREQIQRELVSIVIRLDTAIGDQAIGGNTQELMTALREIVYELRMLVGHEVFPGQPTIIGNIEPRRGEIPPITSNKEN